MKEPLVHVIGSGACWREDFDKAVDEYGLGPICGLNYMAAITDVDILFSLHAEQIEIFREAIRRGRRQVPEFWTGLPSSHAPEMHPGWDRYFHGMRRDGTSALGAVGVLTDFYERVVLSGCPLQQIGYAEGYYSGGKEFVSPDNPKAIRYRNTIAEWVVKWRQEAPNMRGVVSMSGTTKEILDACVQV